MKKKSIFLKAMLVMLTSSLAVFSAGVSAAVTVTVAGDADPVLYSVNSQGPTTLNTITWVSDDPSGDIAATGGLVGLELKVGPMDSDNNATNFEFVDWESTTEEDTPTITVSGVTLVTSTFTSGLERRVTAGATSVLIYVAPVDGATRASIAISGIQVQMTGSTLTEDVDIYLRVYSYDGTNYLAGSFPDSDDRHIATLKEVDAVTSIVATASHGSGAAPVINGQGTASSLTATIGADDLLAGETLTLKILDGDKFAAGSVPTFTIRSGDTEDSELQFVGAGGGASSRGEVTISADQTEASVTIHTGNVGSDGELGGATGDPEIVYIGGIIVEALSPAGVPIFARLETELAGAESSGIQIGTVGSPQVNISSLSSGALPRIASGGESVGASDIVVSDIFRSGNTNVNLVVKLPRGANFASAPSFTVRSGTLRFTNALNDLVQTADRVTLSDANGDGGNDRATVTINGGAGTGTVTVGDIDLTYNGTSDGNIRASVTVGTVTSAVDVADIVGSVQEPIQQLRTLTAERLADQATLAYGSTRSQLLLTVPGGTAAGRTVVLTFAAGIENTGTTAASLELLNVHYTNSTRRTTGTAAAASLISAATRADSANAALQVTLTARAAHTNDKQYLITLNQIEVDAPSAAGTLNVSLSGSAGLTGSAGVLLLSKSGTSVTRANGANNMPLPLASIVRGSTVAKALPTLVVSNVFENDIGLPAVDDDPDTADVDEERDADTITLTPGRGLTLRGAGPAMCGDTVAATGAARNNGTVVYTITAECGSTSNGAPQALTLTGITATVAASASGNLDLELDGSASTFTDNIRVDVATAADRGTVTIARKARDLPTVGANTTGNQGIIQLTESLYGSIRRTDNKIYIDSLVDGVTITNCGHRNDGDPDTTGDNNNVPVSNSQGEALSTGLEIDVVRSTDRSTTRCVATVISESTDVSGANAPKQEFTLLYNVGEDVAVGTEITFRLFDLVGDTGVSGTVALGLVAVATINQGQHELSSGATPLPSFDVSRDLQTVGTITIRENYPTALKAGSYRLYAPTGVGFVGTDAENTDGTFRGVFSTGRLNDTIMVTMADTDVDDSESDAWEVTATVLIGEGAPNGLIRLEIDDGDRSGQNKTNLTEGTVAVGYTPKLAELKAGGALTTNINFSSGNAITGGLAPYRATSADPTVATVAIPANSSTVWVTGVKEGRTTVTVTDALGNSATAFMVTVETGAALTAYPSSSTATTDGSASGARFRAGATSDGGSSFATTFRTSDEVAIGAMIMPDEDDVGESGELYVVVRSSDAAGNSSISYLDSDGMFRAWDLTAANPIAELGAAAEVTLAASHFVTVFEPDNLQPGTFQVYLGYSVMGSDVLVYTSTPLEVTVR